jgi:hypothetical protein
MRDLGLDGLSEDQRFVLLSDETGTQYRVRLDDRLRAASRGDRARLGQVEISMDSALRPRDIQSRIRAGESPEAVAAVAQVSMDRIMAYAGPVLAEREHICQQARRSGLRRKHASGPGRLLGDAVDEHLRSRGMDPADAGWDSWRRNDGRWAVTVAASRSGEPATFLFDVPGRYVVAHDDAARRLVGDEPPLSVEPEPDEPHIRVSAGRPGPSGADPASDDGSEPVTSIGSARAAALGEQLAFDPTPEPMTDGAAPADVRTSSDDVDALARAVGDQLEPALRDDVDGPDESDTGRQRRRKDRRRASVPSWDEIMFGSKPQS